MYPVDYESLDKSACKKCKDENDEEMIMCDYCHKFYHLRCVHVSSAHIACTKSAIWNCATCLKEKINIRRNQVPNKIVHPSKPVVHKMDRLTKDNYYTWLGNITATLHLNNMWIDPSRAIPEESYSSAQQAYSVILMTVGDFTKEIIANNFSTSVDVLNYLRNKFEIVTLVKIIMEARPIDNDIIGHVSNLREIFKKLDSRQEQIEESIKASILICALPTEYEIVTSAVVQKPKKNFTFKAVAEAISNHNHQMRLLTPFSAMSTQAARQSVRSTKFSSTPTQSKKNLRCESCQMFGHEWFSCRKNPKSRNYIPNFKPRSANGNKPAKRPQGAHFIEGNSATDDQNTSNTVDETNFVAYGFTVEAETKALEFASN